MERLEDNRFPQFSSQVLGVEIFCDGNPCYVRHLFIGCTIANLRGFYLLNRKWFIHSGRSAMASLGLLPNIDQVNLLKSMFSNAKRHLVFTPDLTGKVADCKVATWLAGREASFRYERGYIIVRFEEKRFRIREDRFSLNTFKKEAGQSWPIRTHKPQSGFESFQIYYTNNLI